MSKVKVKHRPMRRPHRVVRVLWVRGPKLEPARKPYNRAALKRQMER